MMILTDASGHPIEKPEAPAPGAPIEEVITWMRAQAAWRDRVGSIASESFARAFQKALK